LIFNREGFGGVFLKKKNFLGLILDFNSWGFQFFGTIFGGLISFNVL